MKGRRSTPTALKLLQGNPGHRPIGDVMTREPQPGRGGFREPPAHITGEARAFWYAQGPEFVKMGTLTDADWPVFEDLCLSHEEKHQLTLRINELQTKKKLTGAESQELVTNRGIRRKAIEQFRKLSSEFGGTAVARPRIRLHSGQGEFPFGGGTNERPADALETARRQLTGA
jgi:phage terminase small subunit